MCFVEEKGQQKDQFDLKALSNVGLEKQQKNELIDKFLSEHGLLLFL